MAIQMPTMDGYTATRQIRKWEEKLKAQGSKQEEEKLKAQGSKLKAGRGEAQSSRLKAQSRRQRTEDRGQRAEDPSLTDGFAAASIEHQEKIGLVNKIDKDSALNSAIRNPQSAIKNIPIIAMTAHAMAGDEQKSIAAGMNDHVTKPIDPAQLFAALHRWIKPTGEQNTSGTTQLPDAPEIPDKVGGTANELPDSLPGFDLPAGLARLMGNQRLYRKLLLDFGSNYGKVADDIRNYLDGTAPFCDELIRLAEDFDFDGIEKMMPV